MVEWFNEKFGESWIGCRGFIEWLPPRSPDLSPVFLKLFEVGAHLKFLKKWWAHYTQNLTRCIAKCKKTQKKRTETRRYICFFIHYLFRADEKYEPGVF